MSPSVVDAYTAISVAVAKHEWLAAAPRSMRSRQSVWISPER